MRRAMKTLVLAVVVAGVCAPRQARAESYLNPWLGAIFANKDAEKGFRSFGVAAGDTGSKTGIELNVGYTNKFFDKNTDNYVLDIMAGVTAGPQIGGASTASSVRPYVAGGVGLLRSGFQGSASKDFGFNVGAGVFAYFSNHFGLRGEARYFRVVNGTDLGAFHFARAQIGLLIR